MECAPFFSIVVSACNVAPYVEDMVRSVRAQSFGDFEVIVCCEASIDETPRKLRNAISGDERFSIVDLPRSGSASAGRNCGMERARGVYVVFLDGDDCLKETALEMLHSTWEKFGAVDLIAGSAEVMWELNSARPENRNVFGHSVFAGIVMEAPRAMAEIMRREFQPAVWLQIYRAEFLREHPDLRQRETRRHQDEEWTPRVFLAAKDFVRIDEVIYVYRKRADSVTTKTDPQSIRDITDNLIDFLRYWRTHEIPQCVRREYANWHADLFRRYFLPNFCRQYDRGLRGAEYRRLTGDREDFRAFREVVRLSSISKHCLLPIFILARSKKLFRVCEFLFLRIYYPLIYVLWPKLKKRECC